MAEQDIPRPPKTDQTPLLAINVRKGHQHQNYLANLKLPMGDPCMITILVLQASLIHAEN